MNGVNLIPAARREARAKAARARAWMFALPACAAMLIGAYIFLRMTWDVRTADLEAEVTVADHQIELMDKALAEVTEKVAAAQPELEADKAVGEQPDWSQLLRVIAASLSDQAVLNSCILEARAEAAPSAPAAPAPKPGAKAAATRRDAGRPEHFTLSLA